MPILVSREASSSIRLIPPNNNGIINRSLFAIASQLTSLRHLNLRYLPRITDRGFVALIRRLPHLATLNLSHCPRLSSIALDTLSGSPDLCSSLRVLRLWDCKGASRLGVLRAAHRLGRRGRLELLDVRGCDAPSDDVLSVLNGHDGGNGHAHPWREHAPGILVRAGARTVVEKQSVVGELGEGMS
jgi:hypothetical protein